MKKGLKITLAVIGVFFLLLFLLPFLFKDKIKAKLDSEIAKTINAKVYYDLNQFDLTVFRNFPNLTLTLGDFGMVGQAEGFEGDTLMDVNKFSVVLDIMSVIKGDQIKINSVYLKQPYILTRFNKDGKFSWDITFPDSVETPSAEPEEASSFAIKVEKWEIEDGTIIYEDQTMPMYARLNNLNHTGKGDITEAIYDISTYTKSPDVLVEFDGVRYLNKYLVEVKADLNINMDESRYTFKENEFTINNFKLGFDGVVAMPDTNINVDIKFAAKETAFKNLISLVPAVFMEGYEKLKTEGDIAFDGYAKGTYNAVSMPAFGLNMKINNAMMQYPDLPTSLKNIAMDLAVDCKDGVIDHTIIDLKKFHVDLGNNPIDAEAYVNGLNPYDIQKARLKAQVKLEDITQMFPIDSLSLKGIFAADVTAQGKYSDELKLMPVVKAAASLKDGYIKYEGFPEAIESVNMVASVNSDGNMKTSSAVLDYLRLKLDDEPFELAAKVVNFDDPNYEAALKGIIDLTKMTKLFPLEGTTLTGRIVADLQTKGVMSDVTEGRYGNTATSGSMDITNLHYVSAADLPQGFGLSEANFSFSPQKIDIAKMKGNAGRTDLDVTGYFSNYMGYLFGGKDTVIHGKMKLNSRKVDINEWMTSEEPATTATPAEEEPMTVLEIPKNIDFVLASSIDQVLYDNLEIKNLAGDIIVKDGIVSMKDVDFGLLGGKIGMNGFYSSADLKNPNFDFNLDVKELGIKETFKAFNTVQKLAPMAETMEGKLSTVLKIKGGLGQDMMPLYNTLTGLGNLSTTSAVVKDNKVLSGLQSLTKVDALNPLNLKDLKIKYKIEDGQLKVEPFDLNAGNIKMNIGGANSLDGGLNYKIKMDLPAGAVGSTVNNAVASLTGKASSNNENIKLNFNVGGTVDKPKIVPEGGTISDQVTDVKDAVVDKLKDETDKLKAEAEAKVKAEADRLKAEADKKQKEAEEKIKAEADRIKAELEAKKKEEEEKAKKELEKKLKDKLKF
jgi:hypothetical protein